MKMQIRSLFSKLSRANSGLVKITQKGTSRENLCTFHDEILLNAFCVQKVVGKFLQAWRIYTFNIIYIYIYLKIMFFKDTKPGR